MSAPTHPGGQRRAVKRRQPLWVINIAPGLGVLRAHQAGTNFINNKNNEFGLVLIEDGYVATKTIFRGQAFSAIAWRELVARLQSAEPGCWYDPSQDQARPAFFISNGNRAHQYVRRSALDLEALSDMAASVLGAGVRRP